uniref:Uncharacterized protein n=1 Tax=Cacopsylla melanoneura TaxID=428564 RepID=A0A8D8S1Q3_9HEMI
MVERLHRQLKAAIKCHQNDRWIDILPTVLLGIRSAWKEDIKATSAELVYGEPLRLPGEFLAPRNEAVEYDNSAEYVKTLRQHMQQLRPVDGTQHGNKHNFIFKDLATSEYVFVRLDQSKRCLQMPYDGPYRVINRSPKTFIIDTNGTHKTISIDRLKPAYIMTESPSQSTTTTTNPSDSNNSTQSPDSHAPMQETNHSQPTCTTRSGRRVRFPRKFLDFET